MPSSTAAERWDRERTFHHSRYPPRRIARERCASVSVCLPSRECAATIAPIVTTLAELRRAGAIDEIVVVDAGSADGTAERARRAGATVHQEAELVGNAGKVLGKGDAMWRALPVLSGGLVVYLDADVEDFPAHYVSGLLGPLVCEQGVEFVKAFYRRPFELEGVSLPEGGGRVNHLVARPALSLLYPELACVRQPLAGEIAARRRLLERLPFATGYGVEIAMLIDVWRAAGLEAIAQVDLEVHRNRHQPIAALAAMAATVLATILARAQAEARLEGAVAALAGDPGAAREPGGAAREPGAAVPRLVERPPLAVALSR